MQCFARLRPLFPAICDTYAYSCVVKSNASLRNCSSAAGPPDDQSNSSIQVNKEFINRNPRNLEFMNIAKKRKGWRLQYPNRHFYHRLVLDVSRRHVVGIVEHSSGHQVVSASTREYAISKHLYSTRDVPAAENIGRVLAQRCREAGIGRMVAQLPTYSQQSEKVMALMHAMLEGGIEFREPRVVEPAYEPGIDYDAIPDAEEKRMMGKCPV